MSNRASIALALAALCASPAAAGDWIEARCDVYPKGSDHTDLVIPCTFSQRQGRITITRLDGVTHELSPDGESAGNFRDGHGRAVYRQSGLGDRGLIFRFPEESVYVYWNMEIFEPIDEDSPTWPFSTRDYDATTLLRCRTGDDAAFGECPAGILRMKDGQASVVVMSPGGERFTINFMTDYVNATNRSAEATLDGDTWTVIIDGEETYRVPLAAIEGG